MSDTRLLRRALAVVNASCLVAGLGAAVAMRTEGRGDDAPANAAATPASGGSAAASADGGPAGAVAPAGSSSPAPAALPAAGDTAGAGAVNAPKAGKYRYKTTINDQVAEQPMVVEDVSRKGRDAVQVFVMDVNGSKVRNDVIWSADRVMLSKSAFDFGRSTGDCDWTPDVTQTVLVAKAGTAWQSDSSCTVTMSGVPIRMARRSSTTVAGIERLQVAGETLDVWRFDATTQSDFNGRVSDATEKTWFSPKYGLVVKGITTTTTKSGDKTRTIESLSELQNLEPE